MNGRRVTPPSELTLMRIAVVYWNCDLEGGVATYLNGVIPALAQRKHELGFWHEVAHNGDKDGIALPTGTPVWCAESAGLQKAIDGLKAWRPDLLFLHGLLQPQTESELLTIAPSVFFAHEYRGTCISGAKTFKFPVIRPCQRRFGSPCLFLFYPRRCGGLNPLTMWRDYQKQQQRLGFLRRCAAIVTHSHHMREEYLRHGFPPDKVICLPHFVAPPANANRVSSPLASNPPSVIRLLSSTPPSAFRLPPSVIRLLFLGRMDYLKGGHYLLKALPRIQQVLNRPIDVTFAGDGPARAKWEEQAKGNAERGMRNAECKEPTVSENHFSSPGTHSNSLRAPPSAFRNSPLSITFTGWLGPEQRDELFKSMDLLVVPSLWPEPFGQVGVEAGHHGIPAAAYDVGGISEWLKEGVNGHLASGNPPTPEGLGDAVIKCLADSDHYAHLRSGALQMTRLFDLQSHVAALEEVFRKVVL